MFAGLVIAIAVTFVVALAGIPLAVRAARPKVWSRSALVFNPTGPAPAPAPSFEPLDLGPDPMRWPSEDPWEMKGLTELPWPSQTWDDPHFGAHWRQHRDGNAADAAYEAQQAARRARVAAQRQADEGREARRQQRAQTAAQAPEQNQVQRRARQEMRQLRDRASQLRQQAKAEVQRRAPETRQQVERMVRQQVETQADRVAPGAGDALSKVPPKAELERLVNEVGLAGTVQEIMKRTGWDFKTAAQHLARARRGR